MTTETAVGTAISPNHDFMSNGFTVMESMSITVIFALHDNDMLSLTVPRRLGLASDVVDFLLVLTNAARQVEGNSEIYSMNSNQTAVTGAVDERRTCSITAPRARVCGSHAKRCWGDLAIEESDVQKLERIRRRRSFPTAPSTTFAVDDSRVTIENEDGWASAHLGENKRADSCGCV